MAISTKNNLFNETKDKTESLTKGEDRGFINKDSKGSLSIKKDGAANVVSGIYAQQKLDKDSGIATEISLQSNTITVQKDIITRDLSINKHKLNSLLWELTNFKEINGKVIGNLLMGGTVLVKDYDFTLQKYVLYRRPIYTPIFSNLLDAYAIDENMEVDIDISKDVQSYKRQINEKVTDKE